MQPSDCSLNSDGCGRAKHVSSASKDLLAPQALPDSSRLTLDTILSAKVAVILGVLSHLHLLDYLTKGTTISGSVLARDACLLGVLSHFLLAGLVDERVGQSKEGRG